MMASFTLSTIPTTNNTKANFHKFKTHAKQAPNENNDKPLETTSLHMQNVHRRNLMLGLSSVFIGGISTSLPFPSANATTHPSTLPVCSPSTSDKRSKIEDKYGGKVKKAEDVEFPLKLTETVYVLVKRPFVNRTKEEKEKANEILLVNGVRFNSEKFVKFDVLVNYKGMGPELTPADSEFAGSFAQMPHGQTDDTMMRSGARFGLTEILEDINAEDDEYILVSLVPRSGSDDVTISEIKIELVPIV